MESAKRHIVQLMLFQPDGNQVSKPERTKDICVC